MRVEITKRLKRLHARLDHDIRAELSRRFPDDDRVRRLKKIKLSIKDRLAEASRMTPRRARA
jgi:hypothetical protein